MADRSRSASPAREPKPKKQKTGGFKWKEKEPKAAGEEKEKSSERKYREQSPRREKSTPNAAKEDVVAEPAKAKTEVPAAEAEAQSNGTAVATTKPTPSVADKFGASYKPRAPGPSTTNASSDSSVAQPSKPPKEKKSKKSSSSAPQGPMIIVNINDRLGTKAAIPCLASDSVKAFKAIVAARIGRQPHEIMIKRQGERPFKDALSLEDYGVSSGVQLDLEVDTGD